MKLIASIFAALLGSQAISSAVVLTSASQLSPTNTLIDFTSSSIGPAGNPLTIGGVQFLSSTVLHIEDVSIYSPTPEVAGKLLRTGHPTSIGTAQYVDIRMDFSAPISEIGLGWWDPNFAGNELRVYDSANILLETAVLPTVTVGGGSAVFRGISRSSNDIAYAIARISSPNDVYGLDNISYGGARSVPEATATLPLLSLSLIGLAFVRRTLHPAPGAERRS